MSTKFRIVMCLIGVVAIIMSITTAIISGHAYHCALLPYAMLELLVGVVAIVISLF